MPSQDADNFRSRPRANTTTAFPFTSGWRKQKQDLTPAGPSVQHLSVDALITALTPPAVPSLIHARALASALATCSPLPRHSALNPILAALCSGAPSALQAAGFDILSAYRENSEAKSLGVGDRMTYFALFLGSNVAWSTELWEPRFKALRALTKWGTEVLGIEVQFLNLLKSWIVGAFDGLFDLDTNERAERAERERSIDILSGFLTTVVERPEVMARITEEEFSGVLQFYADMVDRCIDAPQTTTPISDPSSPSMRPNYTHRRQQSSISITSLPSPIVTSPIMFPHHAVKQPADIAINLYLTHLTGQIKSLSPTTLDSILPLLFRALASCASPLPRLTLMARSHKKSNFEDRVSETLNSLFSGPYSATCINILKRYLYPPVLSEDDSLTKGKEDGTISKSVQKGIQTSFGAHRSLREYIRRALSTRLARAYISNQSSIGYSPSGAPGTLEIERDLMERAWPKEDAVGMSGWDAARFQKALPGSVQAWVEFHDPDTETGRWVREGKEKILEEAAGVLKDVFQELDSRDEESVKIDEEEASTVGETLYQLSGYILLLKDGDGMPCIVPLSQPNIAPTPFLHTLSSLLARDHAITLHPLLSTTLLRIADHLTDGDTARLPVVMAEQHDLSPTSPDWLDNWQRLFSSPMLMSNNRPLTRRAAMHALENVYESVKDMDSYRRPLADLAFEFCKRVVAAEREGPNGDTDHCDALWRLLGDEVVLRIVDSKEVLDDTIFDLLAHFVHSASDPGGEEDEEADTESINAIETLPPSPQMTFTVPSSVVSPMMTRVQSEAPSRDKESKEKESGIPSVMSLFSSIAGGSSSRSQSMHPQIVNELPENSTNASALPPEQSSNPRVVNAVSALIAVFSQLCFTPFALEARNLAQAFEVYDTLTRLLLEAQSVRVRLTILQFLMRLRVDRDHRVYFSEAGYDVDGQVSSLCALINRVWDGSEAKTTRTVEPSLDAVSELRRARARMPQERDGRRASRGRGGGPSTSTTSRSRSRVAAARTQPPPLQPKARSAIWRIPEKLPFIVCPADTPSEVLATYDPTGPGGGIALPISKYLNALLTILEHEKSWEILSYVLCHLPVQLANKHLFCGPKSRGLISKILTVFCIGILEGNLGREIERWPAGLKARDAHGLAFHTLSVLVSYKRCFDIQQRHSLVEVFLAGLNGQPATIKCCLHALSVSAFELESSMKKYLSNILEKLSQIMSNPDMAVHILGFLAIIGSHPPLYANFIEDDFKMVFGVALQYLQHHNRIGKSPTSSWALSQHVRILSYHLVCTWFLAVKLPDRPRHVRYITRQLLLANEGNDRIDDPTEVCFDWLARYTYASADPRPTNSLLQDIVMNPTNPRTSSETAISEKTWLLGHSVVTIRALSKLGWIEVLSRRPSGYTKFLGRLENVPMVEPGDVDPDIFSLPASILMDRKPPYVQNVDAVDEEEEEGDTTPKPAVDESVADLIPVKDDEEGTPPRPNSLTGYVWSRSAPSQRRKDVVIDPAFFALQLSAYPDRLGPSNMRMFVDPAVLPRFFSSLDRMPVIDTHKVGIMYVAPGQRNETEILRNTHGSPAYTRFLEGIGRLINLRGQIDVYAGGLVPDEDGEYAYAWWDDIGQILYHTATLMPSHPEDEQSMFKKRHIGNDFVRIIWNDSGMPYRFDTLSTQYQFVNIVIEPHSIGAIAAFSNNLHENEYFKVTVQRAEGMMEFAPVGAYKLISAENLPLLVRQLSLLSDWFAYVFSLTERDTRRVEVQTNWQARLEAIRRFRMQQMKIEGDDENGQQPNGGEGGQREGILAQEMYRDFTSAF